MKAGSPVTARAMPLVDVSRFADYVTLTKPRIVLLVALCAAVGYAVAAADSFVFISLMHAVVGTAVVAAGGAALNQYLERDCDARMRRTVDRPLPAKRLEPRDALVLGMSLTLGGLAYLLLYVNGLTALVGLVSAVVYVLLYTPMKRFTPWCIVVGAFTGALPPVMGWTAAQGQLGWGAVSLFAILFLWQLPHFLAIAWLYRDDYANAGFAMAPLTDAGGRQTVRRIRIMSFGLIPVALLPVLCGVAGVVYMVAAVVLGLVFFAAGLRTHDDDMATYARRVFHVSLAYLPLLFLVLALNRA